MKSNEELNYVTFEMLLEFILYFNYSYMQFKKELCHYIQRRFVKFDYMEMLGKDLLEQNLKEE